MSARVSVGYVMYKFLLGGFRLDCIIMRENGECTVGRGYSRKEVMKMAIFRRRNESTPMRLEQ